MDLLPPLPPSSDFPVTSSSADPISSSLIRRPVSLALTMVSQFDSKSSTPVHSAPSLIKHLHSKQRHNSTGGIVRLDSGLGTNGSTVIDICTNIRVTTPATQHETSIWTLPMMGDDIPISVVQDQDKLSPK